MYRRFGGKREFKKYWHGRSYKGARLLFKFRSGTHGLNEELVATVIEVVELIVRCVILSARVLFTCCGSAALIALVGTIFRKRSNNY